jgi:hypothetical protein
MRNVQKHRRDRGGESSGKMNWSSLVTMSYAICRYVLTCGGVPGIIWEVHSGLIIQKVVLSVRGCLMWGISEWSCLCEENSWLPISGLLHEWVESVPEWASSAHGWTVEDGALQCFDCVGGRWCVIRICKTNSWRNFSRLMKDCLLCINWVSGVVPFGLWCCRLSNGTRWDNLRNCESRFAGKLTVHHGFQNIGAASVI